MKEIFKKSTNIKPFGLKSNSQNIKSFGMKTHHPQKFTTQINQENNNIKKSLLEK